MCLGSDRTWPRYLSWSFWPWLPAAVSQNLHKQEARVRSQSLDMNPEHAIAVLRLKLNIVPVDFSSLLWITSIKPWSTEKYSSKMTTKSSFLPLIVAEHEVRDSSGQPHNTTVSSRDTGTQNTSWTHCLADNACLLNDDVPLIRNTFWVLKCLKLDVKYIIIGNTMTLLITLCLEWIKSHYSYPLISSLSKPSWGKKPTAETNRCTWTEALESEDGMRAGEEIQLCVAVLVVDFRVVFSSSCVCFKKEKHSIFLVIIKEFRIWFVPEKWYVIKKKQQQKKSQANTWT